MQQKLFYRFAWLLSASALTATFTACSDEAVQPTQPAALPSSTASSDASKITGQYIVVLKDGSVATDPSEPYADKVKKVKELGQGMLRARGARPEALGFAYGHALKGFSAALSADEANALRADARVAYVEADRIISLGKPTGGGGGTAPQPGQTTPPGITRVGTGDGTGKTAWVIDTGIDLDHPDLNVDTGRSRSFLSSKKPTSADDGNGHGTHVAGTIAAKNNTIGVVGVAANAFVVAVRVLDASGSGTTSGVIAGVEYVGVNGKLGDVANMSLGGGVSQALDDAVLAASANGVLFALAAGNEGEDATRHSPGRVNGDNIFTISAMTSTGTWASFSNFGTPVDYCMPGVSYSVHLAQRRLQHHQRHIHGYPHMAGVLLLRDTSFTRSGTVVGDPDDTDDPIAHL